jgi:membrane-associated phospholipid phosphatase
VGFNAQKLIGRLFGSNANLLFHRRLAYACAAIVLISFFGCKLTSIHVHIGRFVIALVTVYAMLAPLPLYWHEKGRTALRESTLVIPWELLLAVLLPFTVLIAARLRMPLQDSLFGRIDQSLGVNVPAIVGWANHHWFGTLCNRTYPLLIPLLAASALAPAFLGKVKSARQVLLANLAAFAIGVPAFALLPAVGPWYYYHLAPNVVQANCQEQLFALRLPGPYNDVSQAAGIVCFPSFHAIWAILCAVALWGFRPLRIPVALLSALIIASTVTTGWHYFTDVLAGFIIAAISIAFARACTRNVDVAPRQLEPVESRQSVEATS